MQTEPSFDLHRASRDELIALIVVQREQLAKRERVTARLVTAAVVTVLFWIVLIVGRGALLALQAFGLPLGGEALPNRATPALLGAALAVYLACLGAALLTRWRRPVATLPVTFAMGGGVVLAGAVLTGAVGSLLTVLAMAVLAGLVGQALLRRLSPTAMEPLVRLPLAIALGFGILGLLLFLLAALTVLNAVTVSLSAGGILLLVLGCDRKSLRTELADLRGWRPPLLTWVETILVGMMVALTAFAALTAFVPENQFDSFRQHLPIAREIWQSGSVSEFPPMVVSRDPIEGHLLYAVAWGFGGMTAAKLVHTLVGLAAIIGVGGLGWLGVNQGSQRLAAIVASACFVTMPLVLWLLGHAFVDLFAILFTVTAVLALLLWQREGRWYWIVVAGLLASMGVAAKLVLAPILVALAATIMVVGRGPGRWRERVLAVMAFGLGTAVILPWLIRSFLISGSVPGKLRLVLNFIFEALPGGLVSIDAGADPGYSPVPLQHVGLGHMPVDLLGVPWLLTFHAEQYAGLATNGAGDIGIGMLILLPIALFGLRSRPTALLGTAALVSYVGWWLTPYQISRHLLPTLALVAALVGIGVTQIRTSQSSRSSRLLWWTAQVGLIAGLAVVPLLALPAGESEMPIDLFIGQVSAADYVMREIPVANALAATNSLLPPDTPVGYVGKWGGGQLYTETRLMNIGRFTQESIDDQLGTRSDEVLASLDRLGITHIIWDRVQTKPEDWQSTLLSTEFLRDHGRILTGEPSGYLIEISPGSDQGWGDTAHPNLLRDPGFDDVKRQRGAWTTVGKIKEEDGRVSMREESSIAQRVPVTAGSQYLFIASARCTRSDDTAELTLRWFGADNVSLGTTRELVIPGVDGSEQFVWHRAPDQATSVSTELASSKCEFVEAGLYDLS